MRKTFSNVCCCGPRTSQLPNPQQADDNETSTCGAYLYTLNLYSSFWRGLMSVVYPVWVGQCEGLWTQDGQKNRHLRLFYVYWRTKLKANN